MATIIFFLLVYFIPNDAIVTNMIKHPLYNNGVRDPMSCSDIKFTTREVRICHGKQESMYAILSDQMLDLIA